MMHPQMTIDLLQEHNRELNRQARRARQAVSKRAAPPADDHLALRLCRIGDDTAVARLAALEGRTVPPGRHLVAEVNGEVVAALPLLGGEPLADPFRATAHLLPLMRLRATQLGDQPRARRHRESDRREDAPRREVKDPASRGHDGYLPNITR
jgi:hypothetical protein